MDVAKQLKSLKGEWKITYRADKAEASFKRSSVSLLTFKWFENFEAFNDTIKKQNQLQLKVPT